MIFDILAGIYSACAIFDIWITRRRVIKWGPQVELNPLAQWLYKNFGADLGTAWGILIPQLLVLFLASQLPQTLIVFAFYVGWRLHRMQLQYRSLEFEKKVIKRMETMAASPLPPDVATPSSHNKKEN